VLTMADSCRVMCWESWPPRRAQKTAGRSSWEVEPDELGFFSSQCTWEVEQQLYSKRRGQHPNVEGKLPTQGGDEHPEQTSNFDLQKSSL